MHERSHKNSIDTKPVTITMGQYKEFIKWKVENEYFIKELEKYNAETQRLKETLKMFLVTCN